MTKRLFTFGDSFCKYVWPMWPEVMAQSYDETTNYGLSGVGNFFIFSKFVYLNNTEKLGPDDTVIIQWTEPARFDYIGPDKVWMREGSISAERFFKPGMEQLNADATSYYKTLIYMQSVINMLEATGCKWYFMFISWESMVHKVSLEQKFKDYYQSYAQNNYDTLLDNVNKYVGKHFIDQESMLESINPTFDGNYLICKVVETDGSPVEFVDGHPTTIYFYQYIRDIVSKKISGLNLELMEKFSIQAEQLLRSVCPDKKYNPYVVDQAMHDFYQENIFYKNPTQSL